MKMRRLVLILLALLLVTSTFYGCAPKTPTTEKPQTEDTTAKESELPLAGMKLGFAHLTLLDEWCVSLGDAFKEMGAELGAKEMNMQVAEFDLETQIEHVENFIAQEYDAIFIVTGFTDAIVPTIQEAKDAGIPVIAIDGTIEGDPLVSHIVWDQAETGRVLGKAVGDYIDANLNGEAKIVCLDSKTLEHMAIRQVNFLEVLDDRFGDKITIVNDSDAQTREAAANIIASISEPYDLVYAASDSNAHGAIVGLEQMGRTDIPVFACGGYGQELYDALVKPEGQLEGVINVPGASVIQAAYDQLVKYVKGDKDIPERVNAEFYYISRTDSEDLIATTKP